MLLNSLQVTRASWKLFTAHFWKTLLFSVLFSLTVPLQYFFGLAIIGINALLVSLHAGYGILIIANVILIPAVVLAFVFIYYTIYFAFYKMIGERMGRPVHNPEQAKLAAALSLFGVLFLTSLAIMVGTILLIIPGIIFMGWYAFSLLEFVYGGKHGLEALSESKKRVTGRWWRTMSNLFVPIFIAWAVTFIGTALVTVLFELILGNTILADILNHLVLLVGSFILAPFALIVPLIVYFDLIDNPYQPAAAPVI